MTKRKYITIARPNIEEAIVDPKQNKATYTISWTVSTEEKSCTDRIIMIVDHYEELLDRYSSGLLLREFVIIQSLYKYLEILSEREKIHIKYDEPSQTKTLDTGLSLILEYENVA